MTTPPISSNAGASHRSATRIGACPRRPPRLRRTGRALSAADRAGIAPPAASVATTGEPVAATEPRNLAVISWPALRARRSSLSSLRSSLAGARCDPQSRSAAVLSCLLQVVQDLLRITIGANAQPDVLLNR